MMHARTARIFLIYFLLAWPGARLLLAQATLPNPMFQQGDHNFGDIIRGSSPSHTFTFENQGSEPIQIDEVKTACACLSATWSSNPVAPGEFGFVTLTFHSQDKIGRQHRMASVFVAGLPDPMQLRIDTHVLMEDGLPAIDSEGQEVTAPAQQRIEQDDSEEMKIQFPELNHDFGTVQQGKVVSHTFTFRNTGMTNAELAFFAGSSDHIDADIPNWKFGPGEVCNIEVKLDTRDKLGLQEDYLIVSFEGEGMQGCVLNVKAEVVKQ